VRGMSCADDDERDDGKNSKGDDHDDYSKPARAKNIAPQESSLPIDFALEAKFRRQIALLLARPNGTYLRPASRRCDVHDVRRQRSLRFLHELPKALQLQITPATVCFLCGY
jgi:hypothetical protein